jgi:hypothetical protein
MPNPILPLIAAKESELFALCSISPFIRDIPGEQRFEFSMTDLQDPVVAKNNCGIVTAQLVKDVDFSSLHEDFTVKFTGIQSPAGCHYGILLSMSGVPEEESVIIDFTARQFDSSSPIPLIMDCWEWQVWTESKLGRQGNWQHTYKW